MHRNCPASAYGHSILLRTLFQKKYIQLDMQENVHVCEGRATVPAPHEIKLNYVLFCTGK